MLTKQDLQNIRGVLQEEIKASVPLIVKGELKPIKRKLNRLEKDVRYIVKDFDERIVANTRAIQKLQNN